MKYLQKETQNDLSQTVLCDYRSECLIKYIIIMKQQNNTPSSTERWVQAQFINKAEGTVEVYHGYIVSDQGRVGSLVDNHRNKRHVMKILKPRTYSECGHLMVCLYLNKIQRMKQVHRLVLSSFCPEQYFEGAEVDHLDRDPTNNFLSNLHWTDSNGNCANRGMNPLKKIRVTHLDDGHIEEFGNMMDCSKAFGKCANWCARVIYRGGFNRKYNILIEKI